MEQLENGKDVNIEETGEQSITDILPLEIWVKIMSYDPEAFRSLVRTSIVIFDYARSAAGRRMYSNFIFHSPLRTKNGSVTYQECLCMKLNGPYRLQHTRGVATDVPSEEGNSLIVHNEVESGMYNHGYKQGQFTVIVNNVPRMYKLYDNKNLITAYLNTFVDGYDGDLDINLARPGIYDPFRNGGFFAIVMFNESLHKPSNRRLSNITLKINNREIDDLGKDINIRHLLVYKNGKLKFEYRFYKNLRFPRSEDIPNLDYDLLVYCKYSTIFYSSSTLIIETYKLTARAGECKFYARPSGKVIGMLIDNPISTENIDREYGKTRLEFRDNGRLWRYSTCRQSSRYARAVDAGPYRDFGSVYQLSEDRRAVTVTRHHPVHGHVESTHTMTRDRDSEPFTTPMCHITKEQLIQWYIMSDDDMPNPDRWFTT